MSKARDLADFQGSASALTTGTLPVDRVPYVGRRNLIINGGFDVWQRGTSFNLVGGYTADRWDSAHDGGTSTVSKDLNSGLAVSHSATSTGWVHINQKIEGKNFRNIVYGVSSVTLTLSFETWCSSNEECTLFIEAPTVEDNYASTTTVIDTPFTLNSGTNNKTFTFTVDSSVLKNGLRVYLVDNIGTAGNVIVWQKVQLELGSVATPFEHRSYGEELALCQRYYWTTYPEGSPAGTATTTNCRVSKRNVPYSNLTGTFGVDISLPVTMRAVPSVSFYSTVTGASGKVRESNGVDQNGGVTLGFISTTGYQIQNQASMSSGTYITFHTTAEAEL